MTRRSTRISLAMLVVTLLAVPTFAQTEVEGETAGGAFYKIAVPDGWTPADGLVIWNHGFDLSDPAPSPDLGPLVDVQLSEGYAVAASSYRLNGWAVFKTNKDLKSLVSTFSAQFGEPERIILTGASLGGAVTAHAIEKAKLPNVVGAYMFCGAVGGSRNWDGAFDLRMLYDVVCQDVPEAQLAGGATGLEKNSALSQLEILEAVNACTGVALPKKQRTKAQKRNLNQLIELSNLPENFIETDMIFATQAMNDLIFDKGKLKGKQGLGNANVDYGDDEINDTIQRVEAKRKPKRKLAKSFTPSGRVGDVKIISIHTDGDGLVIVENQSEYASVVPPENLTVGIAVESTPSHCGFGLSEVLSGWQALGQWLATDAQPEVQDLQNGCQVLEPLFGGPCRFDPNYVVPDMDGRVRLRD